MSATLSAQSGNLRPYAQSWAFSLLFHALAVGLAVVFLGDLKLEPQPEPFTWDVALVETPRPNQMEQSALAQAQPNPTTSAQLTEAPVEPQPIQQLVQTVQAVQPVQPVEQKVVQQEARQEVQKVKEVKPATPVMQESPPVPAVVQTVQPVEAPQEKPKEKEMVQTATAYPGPSEPVVPASHMSPAMPAHHEAPSVSHHSEPVVAAAPSAPVSAKAAYPAPVQDQAVAKESQVQSAAPAIQEATLRDASVRPASATKSDFGWLAQALWHRVAMLKRYPHTARVNHMEGRVLLRVVIKEDGHIKDLQVAESSGHSELDQDALEVVRRACPLKLAQPLGRSHVVVQIPINYRLEQ